VRLTLEAVYVVAHFLAPILPYSATNIFKKLGTAPKPIPALKPSFLNLAAGAFPCVCLRCGMSILYVLFLYTHMLYRIYMYTHMSHRKSNRRGGGYQQSIGVGVGLIPPLTTTGRRIPSIHFPFHLHQCTPPPQNNPSASPHPPSHHHPPSPPPAGTPVEIGDILFVKIEASSLSSCSSSSSSSPAANGPNPQPAAPTNGGKGGKGEQPPKAEAKKEKQPKQPKGGKPNKATAAAEEEEVEPGNPNALRIGGWRGSGGVRERDCGGVRVD
jgi:hypothetical protein